MFSIFIEGLVLGFGAAVPLGPINLLIMNEALRSYKKALFIGLGAMSADITYLIGILYGITNYLKNETVLNVLSIFGGFILIYLGYLTFKGRKQKIHKVKSMMGTTLLSRYTKGYLLTLLNPYTILFWLSVTTYSKSTENLLVTIFGLVCAIIVWITLMPYLIHVKKHMISNEVSSIIAVVSSVILLLFGLSLFFKTFL